MGTNLGSTHSKNANISRYHPHIERTLKYNGLSAIAKLAKSYLYYESKRSWRSEPSVAPVGHSPEAKTRCDRVRRNEWRARSKREQRRLNLRFDSAISAVPGCG